VSVIKDCDSLVNKIVKASFPSAPSVPSCPSEPLIPSETLTIVSSSDKPSTTHLIVIDFESPHKTLLVGDTV
jgi:hypothetical protein